jgi:hypothetical protein
MYSFRSIAQGYRLVCLLLFPVLDLTSPIHTYGSEFYNALLPKDATLISDVSY